MRIAKHGEEAVEVVRRGDEARDLFIDWGSNEFAKAILDVSFETNRYSVPFTLIGQAVEVLRGVGRLAIFHRGTLVAEHPELPGKYQLRILPEHGPGAIARTSPRVRQALPRG